MKEFAFDQSLLCHANNLTQKDRTANTDARRALLAKVEAAYKSLLQKLDYESIAKGDFENGIRALDDYVRVVKDVEQADSFFNWRSDFASSVIPEFIYRGFHYTLVAKGIEPLFATRDSVVELTLSGTAEGGWNVRHKNQDLVIGLRREKVDQDGTEKSFVVPVEAFEVKTNIDINKLNGLNFSAERLKRTFPGARYCIITETIDFSLQDNYAAGSIDEIYVLRKQVRSEARRSKAPLCSDVFAQLFSDTVGLMILAGGKRGHVYERLTTGKLIHGI